MNEDNDALSSSVWTGKVRGRLNPSRHIRCPAHVAPATKMILYHMQSQSSYFGPLPRRLVLSYNARYFEVAWTTKGKEEECCLSVMLEQWKN